MRRPRHSAVLGVSAVLLVGALCLEGGLRVAGFGKGALYVASGDYEYIHAPNQHTRPFGHLVLTNELGMRSEPLRPGDRTLAIVVGDSVINGGNHTDHEELATTQLDHYARKRYGERWRVLTVSAGSWGPDNAAAFLHHHGLFGAQQLLVVFSSHDLGDVMDHRPIVGTNPAFPTRPPHVVICDAWTRYLWPFVRAKLSAREVSPTEIDKFDGIVNPGWRDLLEWGQTAGASVTVLLHLDRQEHVTHTVSAEGQQLRRYLRDLGAEPHEETHLDASGYLDSIHPNAEGQRRLFEDLRSLLKPPRLP